MRISDWSSDVCSSDLNVEPDFVRRLFAGPLPRSPSGGPLLGHGGIESGAVDAEGLRPQGVFGQIIGETISVIEPESGFARQHVPFLHSCRCFIKQAKTFFERSEEHTSELQSLMRISYAVFCLKNTSILYSIIRNNSIS